MARISFDEQVARWLRRSNPGYLGGRSESVGPPILPQAALETYKIPQPLGIPGDHLWLTVADSQEVLDGNTENLVFEDTFKSGGVAITWNGFEEITLGEDGIYSIAASCIFSPQTPGVIVNFELYNDDLSWSVPQTASDGGVVGDVACSVSAVGYMLAGIVKVKISATGGDIFTVGGSSGDGFPPNFMAVRLA